MQAGEISSIIKTYFSESAQWKYIEIIKPEVVEKSVLLSTQHIGEKLFKNAGHVARTACTKIFVGIYACGKAIWKNSERLPEQGTILG